MKNIHILPTDKPSRLHYSKIQNSYGYILKQIPSTCNDGLLSGQRNIYITSDEEIKEGDWGVFLCDDESYEEIYQCKKANLVDKEDKKIILTTDSQLIQDGVQAIDDEFLEWFVKNPSCESVEVEKVEFEVDMGLGDSCIEYGNYYKIIIPKEEPKQEKYWIGVVKWNDGTILRTQPFYKYDEGIKVWSSKFSYENQGKFEWIDYENFEEPKQEKDDSYIKEQKERRKKLLNLIDELEEEKLQEEPKQETLEDELWGNVFAKIKQYGLNNEVLTILKQNFNISKR